MPDQIEKDYLECLLDTYKKARTDAGRQVVVKTLFGYYDSAVEYAQVSTWDECIETTVGNAGPGVADTLKQFNPYRTKEEV